MTQTNKLITEHVNNLKKCTMCAQMIGSVVSGNPVMSPIVLVGQAPGDKEGPLGKPFAWTAGKTMFKWFSGIGIEEEQFRNFIYMAAVCRCFPGKNPKGGDRVPDAIEIKNCAEWLKKELDILQPKLIIPVGKLAIAQFIKVDKLKDVIGTVHKINSDDIILDAIPLPHPSGASTWHRTEPGKPLLEDALNLIKKHSAWQDVQKSISENTKL